MATDVEILEQALELRPEQRASLAHKLLRSLESEEVDADADELWAAEIDRRIATADADESGLIDGEVAIQRIRDSLARGERR